MARTSRRWWAVAGLVAAVAVAVGAVLLFSDQGEPDEPTVSADLPPGVGVEAGVRFEVLSGSCAYEVVVTATTTVDPEEGEFCLVRLDVRNKGEEPRSFDASCQFLIDSSGGRHTQREDVLPLDDATAEFFEQELPPKTLAHDIGLYYDVPKGTQAEAVELHTACDSPGLHIPLAGLT